MSTALARAEKHLESALQELQQARAELPAYSIDAATLLAADVRAAARQARNMLKCVGAKATPAS